MEESTYTETIIIPSHCYEVFVDFLLEHTQSAVEEITLRENAEYFARFSCYPSEIQGEYPTSPAQAIIIRSTHDPLETPLRAYGLESSELDSNTLDSALESAPSDLASQSLIEALESLSRTLSKRLDMSVGFAYLIEKKHNQDWIALYQQGIAPLECAGYYIRASWHPPLETLLHARTHPRTPESTLESISQSKPQFAPESSQHPSPESTPDSRPHSNHPPRQEIIINPALAFGSGHHASTFMCVEMLSLMDLSGKLCLDVGCGSGILAIIMAKQGGVVDACDVDELAITETRKNAQQNAATLRHIWHGSIDTRPSSLDCLDHDDTPESTRLDSRAPSYDLICANIVADVLACMHNDLRTALRPAGTLLLSGILESKLAWILQIFGDMRVLERHHKDEWVSLKLSR